MTTRKHIKKQHRIDRDAQRRASRRAETRRRLLAIGLAAVVVAGVIAFALVLAPWSGSGEADEALPAISMSIGDNFFDPEEITIEAGQKYALNLVNNGVNTHDFWAAGSDGKTQTGDDIRTDPIAGGGTASVKIKYDKPGTYYFVCTFHAGQGGTIIVEEPATPR